MPFIYLNLIKAELQCLTLRLLVLTSECSEAGKGERLSDISNVSEGNSQFQVSDSSKHVFLKPYDA